MIIACQSKKKLFSLFSLVSLLSVLFLSCNRLDVPIQAPSDFRYDIDRTEIFVGSAGSSVAPSINNGGGVITYLLTGAPIGVTIDSLTGVIHWVSAVAPGNYAITITAYNVQGYVSSTYQLTVAQSSANPVIPSGFSYSPAQTIVTSGSSGSSATPNINSGGAPITYSMSNAANGVTINSQTGVISWVNFSGTQSDTISVIATNSQGSVTTLYILNLNGSQGTVVPPTSLSYSPSQITISSGVSGSSAIPTVNNGGGSTTYSISGAPAGISINTSTGVISWAGNLAIGTYTLTAVATNSAGQTNTTYSLTVQTAGTGNLSGFSYSPDSAKVYHGIAGSSQSPMVTGTPTSYSITGAPTGVSINPSTGVISWNNSVDYGTYPITVTASNATGSISTTFKLLIKLNPDDYLTPRYTVL